MLYLVLNDPYYHCKKIYHFFNSHQLFQMMPVVQKFRLMNKIHYPSLDNKDMMGLGDQGDCCLTLTNDSQNQEAGSREGGPSLLLFKDATF